MLVEAFAYTIVGLIALYLLAPIIVMALGVVYGVLGMVYGLIVRDRK